MKNASRSTWLAVVGVLALTAGCTTPRIQRAYPGPERPINELATVWGTTNRGVAAFSPGREKITITSVDGHATVPFYSLGSTPSAVYVLPGRRQLGVRYEFIHGVANGSVLVDAQTNHAYQVKALNPDKRTERVFFVVQDVTAQTLVGGTAAQAAEKIAP